VATRTIAISIALLAMREWSETYRSVPHSARANVSTTPLVAAVCAYLRTLLPERAVATMLHCA
jgi:hypothetical protein